MSACRIYGLKMKHLIILALLASCSAVEPGSDLNGTRLRATVGYSLDGARIPIGWHDDLLGVDCHPWKPPGGVMRCFPATLPSYVFADDSCTERVGSGTDDSCGDPSLTTAIPKYISSDIASGTCGLNVVFARGALLNQDTYYRMGVAGCDPLASVPGVLYYAVGDVVPNETFAPLDLVVE